MNLKYWFYTFQIWKNYIIRNEITYSTNDNMFTCILCVSNYIEDKNIETVGY